MNDRNVRVRFAPSPTGFLHVGGARTALYNYLFARQNNGTFILRIEDTDPERSKPEFEDDIKCSLKTLGIEWDEGPDAGGAFGPYRQSERMELYRAAVERLIGNGGAYRCFCTAEELAEKRLLAEKNRKTYTYDRHCLGLAPEEVSRRVASGAPFTIRLRMPDEPITFSDGVRGEVTVGPDELGDWIICRSDGTPTYNFVVVVDDAAMRISHVMRGEEHINNTPNQIAAYRALGLEPPEFVHFTIILGPDKKKLSKRKTYTVDKTEQPIPVNVREYLELGYMPEVINNFFALIGWSPGNDREKMSLAEMTAAFGVRGLAKTSGVLDPVKLAWMSGVYIRDLSDEELCDRCRPFLIRAGLIDEKYNSADGRPVGREYVLRTVAVMRERLRRFGEIAENGDFFFTDGGAYAPELLIGKKMTGTDAQNGLRLILDALDDLDFSDPAGMQERLYDVVNKAGLKPGTVFWPARAALSGKPSSPGVFELLFVFGREESRRRMIAALEKL